MNQGDLDRQLQDAQAQLEQLLQQAHAKSSPTDLLSELTQLAETIAQAHQTLVDQTQTAQWHNMTSPPSWIEDAPDSYLFTDRSGVIQFANPAAASLFNQSLLQGRSLLELVGNPQGLQLAQLECSVPQEVSFQTDGGLRHAVLSRVVQPQPSPLVLWRLQDVTRLKQAEMALQQQIEQEQLLRTIARRIRQSLNPKEILANTVIEVRRFLQVDRVVVYRLEATGAVTVVAEAVDSRWKSLMGATLDSTLTAKWLDLYQQRNYEAIADLQQIADLPRGFALPTEQQMKAILIAPIVQETQLLGLLCAHQCSTTREWRSIERNLLQQLAEQVAIALQQSELYQKAQQHNADLEEEVQKRTQEIRRVLNFESMLKRITDKVRDSLDESQIIQAAVEELTLVLGLSGCNAALYDLEQGISTIRYDYTHSLPTSQGKVAQMDRFPEIYSQLQQGYFFQFCSLKPNPARGQVAMLACPIFVDPNSSQGVEQAVLGDLWLISDKEYVFADFEIRLAQQVANQCAIAIRQARLFQAAQAQVQELEKLNRLKDEFLSTVSHELRTPISNVKMAIHMLKLAPNEERRQRYFQILETESAREAELIDDLLDLQRLEVDSFPIHLETVLLQNWLPGLVEPFNSRIAHQQQVFQVSHAPTLLPMTCDFSFLRRILSELLNNACKYTAANQQISLDVRQESSSSGSMTVFTLRNQADIPASELPNIFEKFYRVPHADPWKQGGTGLGLALVQKLVERLHGSIEVESLESWTTFVVRLPTHLEE